MAWPVLMLVIAGLVVALAITAVWAIKHRKKIKPMSYNQWITLGIVFLAIGLISQYMGRGLNFFWILGLAYIGIGLYGKYYLKGKRPSRKITILATTILSILVILGVAVFLALIYLQRI